MTATTIAQLNTVLQDILTTQANRLARPSGFVQRESKLTGALFVQSLVFSFLANPHPQWTHIAQTAALLGLQITPSGLWQRCTLAAAEFLQQVLGVALQASWQVHAEPVAIPLLQRFTDIVLHDSTQITLLEALAEVWAGNRGELASLKVLTRLSYSSGTLHFALTAGRTSDKQMPAAQVEYAPGTLRLADLNYFDGEELARESAAGVFWLTHILHNTALYTADGQRWSVLDLIQSQRYHAQAASDAGLDLPIELGVTQHLPCRLLVKKVPRRAAAELKRRLCAQARDEGRPVSAAQMALTRWVIFVTNVPVDKLSLAEALVLARVRWQIELLFKLWKSHGAIDESTSEKPFVVLCEVYAKLLAMLVLHWTCVVGLWADPARSLVKAAQVVREHACVLALGFARVALLGFTLEVIVLCMHTACRITRRRDVPATYQLLLAVTELP